MRILMLGWELPPHKSGGLGTACQGIAEALVRQGVQVLFVVPYEHGDEEASGVRILSADRIAPASATIDPTPAAVRASFEVLRIESPLRPYQTPRGFAAESGRSGHPAYGRDLFREVERYALAVAEIARSERFDLVHAHDWMAVSGALLAQHVRRVPWLLHVHACEHDRSPLGPDPRILALEQLGLDRADRVVAVSRYLADRLNRFFLVARHKLRVVHNAVNPRAESDRSSERNGRPMVLFLGRVTHQKGPLVFLEAAERVLRVLPEVEFVVAGNGDLLPHMVERSAELGLARRVRFTGFLSGEEVERAYARADVFVLPSESEPFGITPLEALSADVPVIVSRASGVCEVLTTALRFEPGDAEELADLIVSLLCRPSLRRELVARGRAELSGLCWDARARSLLSIYRELAA